MIRTFVIAMALVSLTACTGFGGRNDSPVSSKATSTLPASAEDLSGTWTGAIKEGDREHSMTLDIEVNGETVTGTVSGGPPNGAELELLNGKLKGAQLTFSVKAQGREGEPLTFTYKGKVSGNQIRGTISPPSPMGGPSWEVTKN